MLKETLQSYNPRVGPAVAQVKWWKWQSIGGSIRPEGDILGHSSVGQRPYMGVNRIVFYIYL